MHRAVKIDPVAVGKRLRELRDAAGLSQRELATDGVTYAYISRLESGDRIPSFQTLIALAGRLDTTAEYLAFGRPLPRACSFCGRHRRPNRQKVAA